MSVCSTRLCHRRWRFATRFEDKPALSEGAAVVLEDLLVFYDQLAESGEVGTKYREKVALSQSTHRRYFAAIWDASTKPPQLTTIQVAQTTRARRSDSRGDGSAGRRPAVARVRPVAVLRRE